MFDRRRQGIPIRDAKELGDQFQALANRDFAMLFGKCLAQNVRDGLGIAIVAHDSVLCVNEGSTPGARIADPFVRAKGCGCIDAFTVPSRGASGRSHQPTAKCSPRHTLNPLAGELLRAGSFRLSSLPSSAPERPKAHISRCGQPIFASKASARKPGRLTANPWR